MSHFTSAAASSGADLGQELREQVRYLLEVLAGMNPAAAASSFDVLVALHGRETMAAVLRQVAGPELADLPAGDVVEGRVVAATTHPVRPHPTPQAAEPLRKR